MYDARLYASVFFQDPYFNDGTGKVYGYDWDAWVKRNPEVEEAYDRPSFRKFMPATYEALAQSTTDVNIPLMRYANVLLMKAEALNDLGRTGEAIPLINDVRRVHGNMPAMMLNFGNNILQFNVDAWCQIALVGINKVLHVFA